MDIGGKPEYISVEYFKPALKDLDKPVGHPGPHPYRGHKGLPKPHPANDSGSTLAGVSNPAPFWRIRCGRIIFSLLIDSFVFPIYSNSFCYSEWEMCVPKFMAIIQLRVITLCSCTNMFCVTRRSGIWDFLFPNALFYLNVISALSL